MLRKPLMTTHEVAEQLRIKEATVRRWIRDGELPAVNLGREWRVAVIQLEEFLEQRVTGGQRLEKGMAQVGASTVEQGSAAARPASLKNGKDRKPRKHGRSRALK